MPSKNALRAWPQKTSNVWPFPPTRIQANCHWIAELRIRTAKIVKKDSHQSDLLPRRPMGQCSPVPLHGRLVTHPVLFLFFTNVGSQSQSSISIAMETKRL